VIGTEMRHAPGDALERIGLLFPNYPNDPPMLFAGASGKNVFWTGFPFVTQPFVHGQ
jgi:hypothetical protein